MRSTDLARWLCGVLAVSVLSATPALAQGDGKGKGKDDGKGKGKDNGKGKGKDDGSGGFYHHPPPACSAKCGPEQYLTVQTTNGPITGHLAPNTSCVLEYLGIPYAQPPVGDLRFAPPQPIAQQSPFVADQFGFDCPLSPSAPVTNFPDLTPQALDIIKYFATGAGTPQSEDCLTLNIWTKATAKASAKKKPVLVFFYGGRMFPFQSNQV
jgi:hypothetical protein